MTTHIVGHWNYPVGVVKPVYVVSSAERVELVLNGRSLGVRTPRYGFLFTFPDVKFEAGKLEAFALDVAGHHGASSSLSTVGEPRALRLTVHTAPDGLKADGADMALIDVEVVDANGTRCPLANQRVTFDLQGSAEWRGGIAQGSVAKAAAGTEKSPLLYEDNFILSKSLPVEAGINRVILRSLRSPGVIHLVAHVDGLTPAQIDLQSLPVKVAAGLAVPSDSSSLSLNLGRGPTPSTPSYTMHRRQISVLSATAGIHVDQANRSIDDNETTSWSNSGVATVTDGLKPVFTADSGKPTLANAWIEYRFAHAEELSTIELKLNGFRRRRYPLAIFADGQEIWRGTTETSLGYWVLNLREAVKTKNVRIALTAPPVDGQQYDAEVNGKVDASGNEPLADTHAPVLSVIEADFYTQP